MNKQKKQEITLIVEDHPGQRLSLHQSLEYRGFKAISAGDVRTALDLIAKLRDELDVVVLDMRLEDKEYPDTIGPDIGIELLALKPKRPPEFLINSGYSEIKYYSHALELGAATYLHKGESSLEEVIRHVRALKLRRAINLDRPEVAEQIEQIAKISRTSSQVVAGVCKQVLEQPLREFLGAPFVFLIKERGGSRWCAGDIELPQVFDPTYDTIQALAFAEVRSGLPYILDANKVPNRNASLLADRILLPLHNAAFLTFRINREVLLSIGILQADIKKNPLAEEPEGMAKVLIQYFQSELLELIQNALSHWKERDRALLNFIAEFCLHTGQKQLDILEEGTDSDPILVGNPFFDKLRLVADDLRDTGNILIALSRETALPGEGEAESRATTQTVLMNKFINTVWNDLSYPNQKSLVVSGDCAVRAENDDLLIVVSRLLSWFAQRFIETPDGQSPQIIVNCKQSAEISELVFEDRSRRLPDALRELLFQPFSQSLEARPGGEKLLGSDLALYLVKVIVETKLYGLLEDRSGDIDSEVDADSPVPFGHRFVIRFHSPN